MAGKRRVSGVSENKRTSVSTVAISVVACRTKKVLMASCGLRQLHKEFSVVANFGT